jgi:anti-sigma-K factor RskA
VNERPPSERLTLDCAAVDELGAAYAIGALHPLERAAVEEHLASCAQPHAELRGMLGADELLAASVEPIPPPPALRDRLMVTIASTPQEGVGVAIGQSQAAPAVAEPKGGWTERWLGWLSPPLARGLAAAAVVVALALGAWNLSLQGSIASRDQQLQAVAAAIGGGQAAFRANGTVGSGYVVEDGSGHASLVVADLAPLEANRIYELWLIGADDAPVAVGTFDGSSAPVAVVPLERGLGGFTTFAVTVEAQRVAAPTSKPVMVASLGA